MEQVLLKENKYSGEYVTIKDISEPTVISHGADPQIIYEEAVKKGCPDPLLLYIPAKGIAQIY